MIIFNIFGPNWNIFVVFTPHIMSRLHLFVQKEQLKLQRVFGEKRSSLHCLSYKHTNRCLCWPTTLYLYHVSFQPVRYLFSQKKSWKSFYCSILLNTCCSLSSLLNCYQSPASYVQLQPFFKKYVNIILLTGCDDEIHFVEKFNCCFPSHVSLEGNE